MKPSPTTPDAENEPNFEQAIADLERSLQALKDRYAQVSVDQQHKIVLEEQLHHTQSQMKRNRDPELQSELTRIRKKLEEVELALESQLFSWSGLKEVFWMAVRFGGIGVIVGWLLKSCAG